MDCMRMIREGGVPRGRGRITISFLFVEGRVV